MFPQITPDQLEVLKIMLAYFAGGATMLAAVCHISHIMEVRAAKRAFKVTPPARRKQMLFEDLDHVEQALDIANS